MGVYVLGIDIGTQGVKGALFTETGDCVSVHGEPSKLLYPEQGAITEDPEYQYQSVLRIIAACVEQAQLGDRDEIAALAVDGQMAGILGVGRDGHAVTPYDSWLDTRCGPYLEQMRTTAEQLVLERAGTAPSLNHGPKKLWWKHEHPEVYKDIAAFVTPGSYAAARLCGLKGDEAFIDKTYLHFSGFSDTRNGVWDREICDLFDMDIDKQGKIVDSTKIVGHVTKEAAAQCGLKAGIPVAAGCGDTVASFLSSGAVEQGLCVDVAGTASVFACTQKEFLPDVKSGILGCCASVMPDLWYSYAYINGGGMNPEWFVKITEKGEGKNRFKEMDQRASEIPDSLSLPLFVPHMAGRVMPGRPDLKGSFAGLSWEHGTTELYWSILEAVALEYGLYKQAAQTLQPDLSIREIRITGGGEVSKLWNTMKSGVLQTPVARIKQNQGAPLGTAMIAAVSCGLADSFPKLAGQWISTGEPVSCEAGRYDFFAKRLERYEALVKAMEGYHSRYPFRN